MVSEDVLTGLHTFLGEVFPLLSPITSVEILTQSAGERIEVGIRCNPLGYNFNVKDGAMVGLCCQWEICMGDPGWSKKLAARIKKCTTQGKWGCEGCKYEDELDYHGMRK